MISDKASFRKLIWLMPAAYAVHIVEEYVGGFAGWVTDVVGGSMNSAAFAWNNVAFMLVLLALIAWVTTTESALAAGLLIAGASGLLFWDFLFHLGMTAILDRYSPGLLTATLLYYPLSLAVARAALRERVLTPAALTAAVAAGAFLLAIAIWVGLFHLAGLARARRVTSSNRPVNERICRVARRGAACPYVLASPLRGLR